MAAEDWKFINTLDAMFLKVINGIRAIVTQPYDEMNKKRGRQFNASRLIEDAPSSTGGLNAVGVYYSIIKTGSQPVDLKSREFAYSGTSIIADIFENPIYTGGTPDPIYNSNGVVDYTFGLELLVGFTLTDEGDMFASSIYGLGPASQVGKGATNALYGTNYILAPNTSYLLKFYSTDNDPQDIAVRIEGYEGGLDFPNNDYSGDPLS
jgi:hypothetical protein